MDASLTVQLQYQVTQKANLGVEKQVFLLDTYSQYLCFSGFLGRKDSLRVKKMYSGEALFFSFSTFFFLIMEN